MAYTTQYYVKHRVYDLKPSRKSWWGWGSVALGIGVLLWGWGPILQYELLRAPSIGVRSFVSPVSSEVLGASAKETNSQLVSDWFPAAHEQPLSPYEVSDYSLSIPRLGITHANVIAGGEDLSKSLIHYGGTAAPGESGTAAVFGHSILPQFFNPKNYTSIFSTLHTLHKGDYVFVAYDGVDYQYQVIDMFEVTPDEISVLEQNYSDKYLLLITCTPPGTYFRRLVVKTKLVPYSSELLNWERTL